MCHFERFDCRKTESEGRGERSELTSDAEAAALQPHHTAQLLESR